MLAHQFSPFPVALSLNPPRQAYRGRPVAVTVKNIGADPIRVVTHAVLLHSHCAETLARGVTVTPSVFPLAVGRTEVVHITVTGRGDFGVVFSALPTGPFKGNEITGGIGAQVITPGGQTCVIHALRLPPPFEHPTNGGGVLILVGVLLAVVAVLLGARWLLRKR